MASEELKQSIAQLPDKPGIYKYYSIDGELIYVGKAKNIKKRVSSYFNKLHHLDNKTRKLVSQIHQVEFTIVNNEFEAYLLENNLIKTNQPKYNILLKDDKTYPYLYISNERFPRILTTRRIDHKLGIFYGPYTSVKSMNNVLELIKKLFTLRTCNYVLSDRNIKEGKYKICLEYHIGNCKGPCENLIHEIEYENNIQQVHSILKGRLQPVKNHFKQMMVECASNLEFERAQQYKQKLESLEHFHSSNQVVNPNISDLEVFTIVSNEKYAVINYLKVIDGIIIKTKNIEIKRKLEESNEELLALIIIEIKAVDTERSEIISNISIEELPQEIGNITVPQIGDKKKLIDLSLKNSLFILNKPKEESNSAERSFRILNTMKQDLRLKSLPLHIECFDNSNLQGTNPVAAMVCFKNARPAKKEYRHFHIKTVIGPNDFDSMYEIVTRRYKRLIEESLSLPDLIIIDGGKGQLSAACRALENLGIYGQIPIIGIAKRLEEIYYPSDTEPLYINKKSESLTLIQQIRDETHRFAITFHRNTRSKLALHSEIEGIKGIGEQTFKKLMEVFKSVEKIKITDEQTLISTIGKEKTKILLEGLNKKGS